MTDSMRDRFARVTTELMDSDERVAIVLADISGDKFKDAQKRHPLRRINVGIREQLLINAGAGMALAGMRPVVHTFAPFLVERAFEQIKLGFAHQGVGGVLVSIGGSYDTPAYGRTHQAPGDVALMATLPGVRIHVPGHSDEAEALLREAVAATDIVYIRLDEATNDAPHADTDGRLVVMRRGGAGSVTVVAVGPMLDRVLAATASLDVTVLYAATVRPFDGDGLRSAMRGDSVAIVEPYLEGTSSDVVAAALSDRAHRLLAIGVGREEVRMYGSRGHHDRIHGLDVDGLRQRIEAWASREAAAV